MIKTQYQIMATIVAFTAALTLQSCHRSEASGGEKDEKFQVTDTLLRSLLIDTVKEASALSEIRLTGSIAPDENKSFKIFPMVSGVAKDGTFN